MSVTVLSAVERMILTAEKMKEISNISTHASDGLGTMMSSSEPRLVGAGKLRVYSSASVEHTSAFDSLTRDHDGYSPIRSSKMKTLLVSHIDVRLMQARIQTLSSRLNACRRISASGAASFKSPGAIGGPPTTSNMVCTTRLLASSRILGF